MKNIVHKGFENLYEFVLPSQNYVFRISKLITHLYQLLIHDLEKILFHLYELRFRFCDLLMLIICKHPNLWDIKLLSILILIITIHHWCTRLDILKLKYDPDYIISILVDLMDNINTHDGKSPITQPFRERQKDLLETNYYIYDIRKHEWLIHTWSNCLGLW